MLHMLSRYGQVYSLVRSSEARFRALEASTDGLPEPVLAAISTASEGAARLKPGFCQGVHLEPSCPHATNSCSYAKNISSRKRRIAAQERRSLCGLHAMGLWLVRPVRIRYREASHGMAVDVYLPLNARFVRLCSRSSRTESSANGSSNPVRIRALPPGGVVLQSLPTSSSPPWKLTMP